MRFRPDAIQQFRLTDLQVDPRSGVVELGYALDDVLSFRELVDFGPSNCGEDFDDGFVQAARLLHLAAGTSYYKLAAPHVVVVETGPLSGLERRFLLDLYDKGLREFAWHNGLPLHRQLTVHAPPLVGADPALATTPSVPMPPPAGLGIPIGGGKDSAVVVEALRDRHPVLLSVNGHPAAHRVAAAAGLPVQVVKRVLDPGLVTLNAAGARNGHVPVTAIVSLIAVAGGYRFGYDTTVMALESSADEPTRTAPPTIDMVRAEAPTDGSEADGGLVAVNHQWSKSTEFERSLQAVLGERLGSAVRYQSVLRNLGELEIAACFAGLPRYHQAFVSCNRAFIQAGGDGWCGRCPKCRFVFLALATAMDPAPLSAIFGSNLLDDAEQVAGFRDLFEEGRKPFECVGTRAESMVAMDRLRRSPQWADTAVVRALAPEVGDRGGACQVVSPHVGGLDVLEGIRRGVGVAARR